MTELPKLHRYLGFLTQAWAKLPDAALHDPAADPCPQSRVLEHTIDLIAGAPGLRLELGVWQGNSIRRCAAAQPEHAWYGFDSFEGFPDDGRVDWQKPFKVVELPETPENVTLVKGYFSETLSPFLAENPGPVTFVNIDCDIYSSTVDIFSALEAHHRLRPGLVIYFDELLNYADYMWNESLALFEMLERTGYGVEWIAHAHRVRQPEHSIRHFYDGDHPTWMEDLRAGYWQQASLRLTELGIDYGPVDDPAYREKLNWMAEGFKRQEGARVAALEARNARLADLDRIRAEREVERKRRVAERNEARRREAAARRNA